MKPSVSNSAPGDQVMPVLDADEQAALAGRSEVLRVERDAQGGEYPEGRQADAGCQELSGQNCVACHLVPAGADGWGFAA